MHRKAASARASGGPGSAPAGSTGAAHPHRVEDALLLLAWLAIAALVYAIAATTQGSYDSYRDAWFAAAITGGTEFPALGPGINRTFHLGPLWFYLLALPSLVLEPVRALLLVCALAIAAKYPLAYLLGRALGERRLGLVFAVVLAFPGWWLMELAVLTHTSAVSASVILLALAAVRVHQHASWTRLSLLGAAIALALHAHPTTLLFCGIAALAALLAVRRQALSIWRLVPVVLLPLAAVLPYLLSDQFVADLDGIGRYGAGVLESGAAWTRLPALLWATTLGGAWFFGRYWLLLPPAAAWAYAALPWAVAATALLVVAVATRPSRPRCLVALLLAGLLFAQCLLLAAVRPITPPWMGFSLYPPMALALASMLAAPALSRRAFGWLLAALAGAGAPLSIAAMLGFASLQEPIPWPSYPQGSPGTMSITAQPDGMQRLHVVDYTLQELPGLLPDGCAPLRLHGALALVAERSLGYSWMDECGGSAHVRLGGAPQGKEASTFALWDSALARHCGSSPQQLRDPAAFTRYASFARHRGQPLGDPHAYPPRPPGPAPVDFELTLTDIELPLLMVGNLLPDYQPLLVHEARVAGQRAEPVAATQSYTVFRCAGCAAGEPVDWSLRLRGDRSALDVVAFACP